MKKINILTRSVYNRIAAGEVVDRPYSVVKELVENSLDAGATQIDIYIENGGKSLIKVVDNGSGIERDDLRAAFFAHATSKISSADDLQSIATLGFRGEALSSISAISRVELVSVTKGNPAYKIICEGGQTGLIEPAILAKGTVMTVRDLFYNTPARAKFMNSDSKEKTDITSFVTRFILCKPYVSFRYYVDGKLSLQSDGEGLEGAVARIYGAETLSQCFKINADEGDIKLSGFISNQNFFKPNKTYQSIFLNGRYIVNSTIAMAISTAYAAYTMKRQYPFYVLNIEMPSDLVDVNVHPNKADVRLADDRHVFGTINKIISSILDGSASAAKFVADRVPQIKSTIDDNADKVYNNPQPMEKPKRVFAFGVKNNMDNGAATESAKPIKYYDPRLDEPLFDVTDEKRKSFLLVSSDTSSNFGGLDIDEKRQQAYEKRKYEQQMIEFESRKYRGKVFNTYLIYEIQDSIYLIDQHAAHERLIYDRLKAKFAQPRVDKQSLLVAFLFPVNEQEKQFINDNIMLIRSIGFNLAPYGEVAFRIDEVPFDLRDINLKEFTSELLAHIDELKEIELPDLLKDKIATMACKSAVKGGQDLKDDEVKALFDMLKGNLGLKCPHGRPICVEITRKDLEKMFKRIV